MQEFLIQALGFLALLMFLGSFQFKSNRALATCQLVGNLLFALQFLLLGGAGGGLSLLLSCVRNLMVMQRSKWKWVNGKGFLIVFCAGYCLITILTWEGPLSLLALLPSLAGTLGFWTNNPRTLRLANLFCACPSWFLYDIMIGSWGAALNEVITAASILISIYRLGWKNLDETQKA